MASRYAVPDCIIPERGQGSENGIQPSTKQRSNVLQDDEAWSQFANKTGDFVEQAASLAGQPHTIARDTDVLAGEATANSVNGNSIGSKSFCGKFANVSVAGDFGPVLCENTAGKLLYFAESDGFKTARAFKAKAEATDAAEQVQHPQLAVDRVFHPSAIVELWDGHLQIVLHRAPTAPQEEGDQEPDKDFKGGHAALSWRAISASSASSVLAFGSRSPRSKRETVAWLTPSSAANADCDRPRLLRVCAMSMNPHICAFA